MLDQNKIELVKNFGTESPVQFAALCLRKKRGKKQVLLITSRDTGRWVIPKGWFMPGKSGAEAAEIEAWEEAGVIGRVKGPPLGSYLAVKDKVAGASLTCLVEVYPVDVKHMKEKFPEAGQRDRKWMGLSKAAGAVREEGLADIFRSLM